MEKLNCDIQLAYEWAKQLVNNTWIKAFFNDFPKCDMIMNNYSYVLNSYTLEAREIPFLSILETLFYKIMLGIGRK
jgi:hypothetical protein